jgi:hypothetical protein
LEILKKSIILSPASCDGKSDEKGILTLQKEMGKTKGVLKCFHLNEREGKLLLGITFDNNVLHKFPILKNETTLFRFTLPQEENLSSNISCVLIQMNEKDHTPIIWGSTTINKCNKLDILENMLQTIVPVKTKSETQENNVVEKKPPIEIEEEYVNEEVESFIDDEYEKLEKELEEQKIKKQLDDFMPYKQLFETGKNIQTASNAKNSQIEPAPHLPEQERKQDRTRDWFYDEVKDQIDALFDKYEKEEALEEIIPNARFVRVVFEEGGDSYIFGIIYDENQMPEYIVYGIPSVSQKLPPEQLEGYYQWLPLDPEKPEEDGYFLMYQDAKTGEHVKIEII